MKKNDPIEIVVEWNDGQYWGWIDHKGWSATPTGVNANEVIEIAKKLIADHKEHEGKEDKYWGKVDVDSLEFDIHYDLQVFFREHDFLKISSIAEKAGLNPTLVRNYASGHKHPSMDQAKKIENAVRQIGRELQTISIHA